MTRWEYKEVQAVDLQGGRANDLGREGWELICILPEGDRTGGARNMWVFKRHLGEFGGIRQFTGDGQEISR